MKKREHKILDKPVLAAILLMIWGVLWYSLIGGVPGAIAGGIIAGASGITDTETVTGYVSAATSFSAAAAAILGLVMHRIWFAGEYRGSVHGKLFRGKDVMISWLVLFGVTVITDIIGLALTGVEFKVSAVAVALMAGIGEEMAIRVLPVSVMMRDWMDEKHIPAALWFSSVAFGLIHLENILSGAGVAITIVQVIMAVGIGVFFAAIYLRSGNILMCMIFHVVHDFICLLAKNVYSASGVAESGSAFDMVSSLILGAAACALGIYMTRKSVRSDIVSVWRERWNVSESEG